MNHQTIKDIKARHIIDSRGNPTVEAEIHLNNGTIGRASVPSGASTGDKEAKEIRDKKAAWCGKGVTNAINNITQHIKPSLIGMPPFDIKAVDNRLLNLDGTEDKSKLGANAILAVSLANVRAGAACNNQFLFEYIRSFQLDLLNSNDLLHDYLIPTPMMNILNGGSHADNNLDIQEFMIVPINFSSFSRALQAGVEIFHSLKTTLKSKGYNTGIGDEGGFAPTLQSNEEAIELILESIVKAQYQPGKDVAIALDVAASEFYSKKTRSYILKSERKTLRAPQLIKYYQQLCNQYPIISIEDGLDQNDWETWKILTELLGHKVQIVGDDLTVTNPKLLEKAIKTKAINAILIKPNQIGTFSETLETIQLAKKNNFGTIISHRSGETEDTFIADFAVATGAGQIKTGSLCRTDRTSKYNQLLRIEEALGKKAKYVEKTMYGKQKKK